MFKTNKGNIDEIERKTHCGHADAEVKGEKRAAAKPAKEYREDDKQRLVHGTDSITGL